MFRVGIAPDKAEDADGLAPIKDDNAVWHNSRRNRLKVFMGVQYINPAFFRFLLATDKLAFG